jgi:hypothetical protein
MGAHRQQTQDDDDWGFAPFWTPALTGLSGLSGMVSGGGPGPSDSAGIVNEGGSFLVREGGDFIVQY